MDSGRRPETPGSKRKDFYGSKPSRQHEHYTCSPGSTRRAVGQNMELNGHYTVGVRCSWGSLYSGNHSFITSSKQVRSSFQKEALPSSSRLPTTNTTLRNGSGIEQVRSCIFYWSDQARTCKGSQHPWQAALPNGLLLTFFNLNFRLNI